MNRTRGEEARQPVASSYVQARRLRWLIGLVGDGEFRNGMGSIDKFVFFFSFPFFFFFLFFSFSFFSLFFLLGHLKIDDIRTHMYKLHEYEFENI